MRPSRPRRSVLYVPAVNDKALAKLPSLACDAVIFDLEDAVSPDAKEEARERLRRHFADNPQARYERIVRINELSGAWGTEDFLAARACRPDAILLPKVDGPDVILDAVYALQETDAPETVRLWAMVETPRAMLELGALAGLGRDPGSRLDCFVAGTNDLVKDTGIVPGENRGNLAPLLLQMVVAARAGGLDVLDGVSNDFRDLDAFGAECAVARRLGFDGKTLIHPAQIGPANDAFAPAEAEVTAAREIVAAFEKPENRQKGVISLDGRMIERLHLAQAEKLLAKAERLSAAGNSE